MRSMQWQLGILGTIPAFAYRHRETKKNLCRGDRSQDLPNTDLQPAVRHLKQKLKVNLCTPQRRIGGVAVQRHLFLTSAVDRREWPGSCSGHFYGEDYPKLQFQRVHGGSLSEKREMHCTCQESYCGQCSPQPIHYTGCAISGFL